MIKKLQVDLRGQSPDVLSDDLVAEFQNVEISWCSDGTAVISVDGKNDGEIKSICSKYGIKMMRNCREDIKQRANAADIEPPHEILEEIDGEIIIRSRG